METTTSFLGLRLAHPFILGACPLGLDLDEVRRIEDAGAAAVVLPSLFEEQITFAAEGRIRHMDVVDSRWERSLSHFPAAEDYPLAPDEYVEHLLKVKQAVAVPVIASLNGTTGESWLTFSRTVQEAGADALEVNLYEIVTDLTVSGAAVEGQLTDMVRELKLFLKIPVAVKLSPFFSSIGNVALQLDRAGADGLVLFNRFYQSDIDIETVTTIPRVTLSTSADLLLRLRWTAILHGHVRASLALTGGVATPDDGVKAILAGAHAVQIVSAILRHGSAYFSVLRDGLTQWMERHEMASVDDMRGRASLTQTHDPAAFERANYIRTLRSWRSQ